MRNTNKTEKNCACDDVFCLHPTVAYKGIATACTCNVLTKKQMRKNLAKWLPHKFCNNSVTFTRSTTCGLAIECLAIGVLAIECLGVHAMESLDVRVATYFVKMRKKVARNRFYSSDSSIVIMLAMLRRMVFASFSRSSE